MAVKISKPKMSISAIMERAAEIMKEEIMVQLQYLGEECVKRQRQKHPNDWLDHTKNLRSSIGYAIFDYGKNVMESAFEALATPPHQNSKGQMVGGGTGELGSETGRKYVNSLATQYAHVYALVVVAGMNYAEYVEATGRDVLAGAELYAKKEIDGRIKDAREVAEVRIQKIINQSI